MKKYRISLQLITGKEIAYQVKDCMPQYELAHALVVLNSDSSVSSWHQYNNIFYFNLCNGCDYKVVFYLLPAESLSLRIIKKAIRRNSQFMCIG